MRSGEVRDLRSQRTGDLSVLGKLGRATKDRGRKEGVQVGSTAHAKAGRRG